MNFKVKRNENVQNGMWNKQTEYEIRVQKVVNFPNDFKMTPENLFVALHYLGSQFEQNYQEWNFDSILFEIENSV